MQATHSTTDDHAELLLAVENSNDAVERRVLNAALTDLDFGRYTEIRREHAKAKWRKFLDLTKWLQNKYERAVSLRLNGSDPRRILDLGCGPGHFSFVCRHLEHEVVGTDVPGDELFRDLNSFLGNRFEEDPVLPGKSLRDYGQFDLITALSANFYRRPGGGLFDANDWRFFLEDMRSRLKLGGRMLLHLNKLEDEKGMHIWDDDFRGIVEGMGGQLDLQSRRVSLTA